MLFGKRFLIVSLIFYLMNCTVPTLLPGNTTFLNFTYELLDPVTTLLVTVFFETNQTNSHVLLMYSPENDLNENTTTISSLSSTFPNPYMDIQSAILGNPQYLNIAIDDLQANQTNITLYFAVFNFDPPYILSDKLLNIDIQEYSNNFFSCPTCASQYLIVNNQNQRCLCYKPQQDGCRDNLAGNTCKIVRKQLTQGETQAQLNGEVSVYYRISNPQKESFLSYKVQEFGADVMMFIQFQKHDRELAGYLNRKYLKIVSSTEALFKIEGTSNVLITLTKYNSGDATAQLQYIVTDDTSNIGIIVGVIVACLSLFVIVIVVVCIVKKRRNAINNEMIVQQSHQIHVRGQRKMNDRQLKRYFPSIKLSSVENINSEEIEGNDCIICLNAMKENDLICASYCQHTFHSQCLFSWFKKNQNCPYCRTSCSLKEVTQAYEKLKIQKKKELYSEELVQTILTHEGQRQGQKKPDLYINESVEQIKEFQYMN